MGELRRQVLEGEPRPPRTIDDKIPAELETISLKAMAKEPTQRYTCGADIVAELYQWRMKQAGHVEPRTNGWAIETEQFLDWARGLGKAIRRVDDVLAAVAKDNTVLHGFLRAASAAALLLVLVLVLVPMLVLTTRFLLLDSPNNESALPVPVEVPDISGIPSLPEAIIIVPPEPSEIYDEEPTTSGTKPQDIVCRRKPSGNMPVARVPRRRFILVRS
jgi:hypothetical protein